MDEPTHLLMPLETLQDLLNDCEETGEAVLYFQKREGGYLQVSTVDPASIREVRDPYSGWLMGFTQNVKGLPMVYFSSKEMMKLRRVR